MTPPKSKPPERDLSPEKTQAILEGAMQEFLERGFTAATMDRVASAAGVSKATVYSHFQDKEGLFAALIQQMVQKKFQSIFAPQNDQMLQEEPEVVLRRLATIALSVGTNDPQFLNFLRLIIGESGRFPQLAQAFVRNIEKTSFSMLRQYFSSCPKLKLRDPEATARVFIGALIHFMIVQEMLHGKDIIPMERDRLVDTLIELITSQAL
ncbi:TetR/AcrR family transcriptional regulator [Kovacikia minuta CCNUW1]|uniref:TetR/AcrR family transcriptional regulator n=1 Tax=Kovacikia minuta TaxID=2931930 RepID=UPI001CCAA950|nr:TetR/AcrR family transcriptional regulator [Kovacikia minuta]UBF27210.1 TetR/AcrR family transcriptional regulator [Kovacikia minuta CCNUW1]